MQGKNPSTGLLLVAVFLFAVFWTLVYSGGFTQPNKYEANSTEQHAQPEAAKASEADDRLADYTFWLTGFTGLLAFVSGIQGWLLIRADRAATVAANASRETTKRSMDLREKQFSLAADEHQLAAKQHGLQRLQYLAEHRPRIRIRSVGIQRTRGIASFQHGKPIIGSLVIINNGACDANIREADYRFYWGTELPMKPPLEKESVGHLLADLPQKIAGHGSCFVRIESLEILGDMEAFYIARGDSGLWIMGAIRYSDWDVDADRWMHFCQRYLPIPGEEGRFVPVDNPDYQYED